MPGQSTGRDLHIDVPLTNIMMRYRPEGMIADQLAPIVNVKKQSDGYYIWSIADIFRIIDDYRAPGREARNLTRSVSSSTFFAKNYALKYPILYEDIKNADAPDILAGRQSAGEAIIDQLNLNWEYRVAQMVTSGSNVGSYTTVASAWNTNNSDPIGDIDTAISNIAGVTGIRANSVVFGINTWNSIKRHSDVIDGIFGSGLAAGKARVPDFAGIKNLFNLERVLIGGGYYNSGGENQTASLSALWDDVCLVYYAPLRPRKDKASFMYSFRWNAVPGMNMQAQVFDEPKKGCEDVQVGYYQDETITGSALGFLITGCNSSQ